MRKIVQLTMVSLDGYMAGPDGDLGWHRVDEELHTHFNEVLGAMSAFLNGRANFELMLDVWPTADTDPDSSPATVEFARIWRDMPQIVYSRTLEEAGWENATLVREVVAEEVMELKAQPGGDMVVAGATLAAEFRRLDLIDEYRLYVNPVVLGRGRPVFPPSEVRTDVELVETRTFGNGVVLLRYRRAGPEAG